MRTIILNSSNYVSGTYNTFTYTLPISTKFNDGDTVGRLPCYPGAKNRHAINHGTVPGFFPRNTSWKEELALLCNTCFKGKQPRERFRSHVYNFGYSFLGLFQS